MAQLFVLFEHATGYALFKIAEFEEISSFVPQVQRSTSNINAFKGIVELISFHPFTTGRDALENMNSVSEGILHPHLQHFLENNLPKSKKKRPVTLGVGDSKLAAVIAEILNINCSVSGVIPEIIRGIRLYFHKLVEGIKDLESANKAQLGLGHHYSRARVKFNVNKIDNMIIQSINIVDQLDKDINTFSMRIREWYSFHFPELIKIVPENHLFIKCVGAIRDRKDMSEDIEEKLNDILMDNDKVQRVVEVAHSSMGMDISPLDMDNITVFAIRINSLMNRRKELLEYLKSKMHSVAPNLATLIGELVGARLIAHAGSLINLAKFPASTVQILGAEKALFRALKTRGNTPKYGLIYHSTFIGRAGKTNKGRISRYLANKCSVASRIDCFRDIPTEVFGSKLRQQVEDRLKFYETGELPDKNVDVMTSALTEADIAAVAIAKERRKAEKRARKRLSQQMENITNDSINNDNEVSELSMIDSEPKKKKRKHSQELNNSLGNSFDANTNDESGVFEQNAVNSVKKKKKHKKQTAENDAVEELSPNKLKFEEQTAENIAEELSAQKVDADEEIDENYAAALAKAKRKAEKKERKRLAALANMSQDSIVSDGSPLKDNGENSFEQSMTNSEKKKKKKKNKHSIEE